MKNFLPGNSLLTPLGKYYPDIWKNNSEWVKKFREKGKAKFLSSGLPSNKKEAWKYTDLSRLSETKYSFSTEKDSTAKGDHITLEDMSPFRLVFINGIFSKEHSSLPSLGGLYVSNFGTEINMDGDQFLDYLGKTDENCVDELSALNMAYLSDGAIIRVEKNISPEFPIHIVYFNNNKDSAAMHYPRNLIIAEANSTLTVIEEYISKEGSSDFTNTVTEIFIDNNASVNHYKIQNENHTSVHIGSLKVVQGTNTNFSSLTASFGGKLTRNNISSNLNGSESQSNIEGLYLIKGKQHIDNHTTIRHNAPSCKSSENFNGVLDDNSSAVFDGSIYVSNGSVKTDSIQSNRSLLLSDTASVNSKPTLEIYADDVKCSHSATVGQLDVDSLYYLRSRGIGEKGAMKMLTSGFLKEILEKFKDKNVSDYVENIFKRGLE